MKKYVEFIDTLKVKISTFQSIPKEEWDKSAVDCVDGLAADELRRLINLNVRRKSGAFFTNSQLANLVLQKLSPDFNKDSVIYDPACGAGNLLISIQDYLQSLNIKLNWQTTLLGTDIHEEFVEAAKLRLLTNSLLKSKTTTLLSFKLESKKKYSIKNADGLENNYYYKKATHIFVNPPFNQVQSPKNLVWAKGKVSAAALFIDKIIEYCNPGTSIIAILPDVLRSGSRYEKWRSLVKEKCTIEKFELLGIFDKHADVDVYAIKLTKRKKPSSCSPRKTSKQIKTLKDLFKISVGTVVDNRDKKQGPLYPYVISRGLIGWSTQKELLKERKHGGKTLKGPFVVIKRTSRKEDAHRAVATIIHVPKPVFVDNHLIVLQPNSKTLKECRKALEILKRSETDEWLNRQIRCRHLTVKIVKDIPV